MSESASTRYCLTALLLLAGLPASAQEKAEPVVSVERVDSLFNVHASVVLPLTACNAYRLLTDYGSLPNFVPGLLQIRYKRISPTRVDVWQEGEVEVLLFRVTLVSSLEMEETPERRIVFRQTEGDLESYSGVWNLMKTGEGTSVSYDAAVALKPTQMIPAFLAKSVLEKEVGKRFEALAKEASRRGNKVVPECVSGR
jgi:ribosome-associated toxin RatA of RatAB toxin-antitoxin module